MADQYESVIAISTKQNSFPITRSNHLVHIDNGLIEYTTKTRSDLNRRNDNCRLTEEERKLLVNS